MSFDPQPYYTRKTLAAECGISLRSITEHLKKGTARLNKAAEKVPGLGVRINGPLARKFIEMMKAKKCAAQS